MKRQKISLLAAAVSTLMVLAAAPAQARVAQTFQQYSCRMPSTAASIPIDGWSRQTLQYSTVAPTASNEFLQNSCADPLNVFAGGFTAPGLRAVAPKSYYSGQGSAWLYSAPANLSLERMHLRRFNRLASGIDSQGGYTFGGGTWFGWPGAGQGDSHELLYSSSESSRGSSDYDSTPTAWDSGVLPPGTSRFFSIASCRGSAGNGNCEANDRGGAPPSGLTSVAVAEIYSAAATLKDASAPTVSGADGSLTDARVHQRKVEGLSFDASDLGGGVYRSIVEVKLEGASSFRELSRSVVDANGGKCADAGELADDDYEFLAQQPCRAQVSGATVQVNLAELPAGAHTLRVAVEDAGGNRTTVFQSPDAGFKVTNDSSPSIVSPAVLVSTSGGRGAVEQPHPGESLSVNSTLGGGELAYSYAWLRCSSAGTNCLPISGATQTTYSLAAADLNTRILAVVTGTNDQGQVSSRSEPSGVVTAGGSGDTPPTLDPGPATTTGATGKGGVTSVAGPSGSVNSEAVSLPAGCTKPELSVRFLTGPTTVVKFSAPTTLRGRLMCDGKGVPGAQLTLSSQATNTKSSRGIGAVTTLDDGTFSQQLGTGPSRKVTVSYGQLSAVASLNVRGKVTLKPVKGVRRPGSRIVLSGRVLGGSVPAGYKLRLQASPGGAYQDVKDSATAKPVLITVRPNGRFTYSLRLARGQFKVRVAMTKNARLPYLPTVSPGRVLRVG